MELNPHCDLGHEGHSQIFQHDALPHDNVSPLNVWLQNVQQFITVEQLYFKQLDITMTLTLIALIQASYINTPGHDHAPPYRT